ncbi:MAG: hypothetical protein JWM57_910 [Phycisphaerales bacterium]|nr:hypothetical protein [Phycisphaerales bacterium]
MFGFRNSFALLSGITVLAIAVGAQAATINFDIGAAGSYTGTGVSSDTGTKWNELAGSASPTISLSNLVDSQNVATGVNVSITTTAAQSYVFSNNSLGSPNPLALVQEYTFFGTSTVTISNLTPGSYTLYAWGHGDQANQAGNFAVAAANGGETGSTGSTGTTYRDLLAVGAQGYSYLKFSPIVGVGQSTIVFTTGYLSGFQLEAAATPEPASLAIVGLCGVLGLRRKRA